MGSSPSADFTTSTREALDTLKTPCTFTRTFTFTLALSPDGCGTTLWMLNWPVDRQISINHDFCFSRWSIIACETGFLVYFHLTFPLYCIGIEPPQAFLLEVARCKKKSNPHKFIQSLRWILFLPCVCLNIPNLATMLKIVTNKYVKEDIYIYMKFSDLYCDSFTVCWD